MVQEFRAFILRGNVVDLAIAVVIGVAFGAVVNSMVTDLLTPLIAAIFGKPDFSSLDFSIGDGVFTYGNFLNALLSFVSIAAAVFFFVVKPLNLLLARSRTAPPADPTEMKCLECLSTIPVGARRCRYCTAVLAA